VPALSPRASSFSLHRRCDDGHQHRPGASPAQAGARREAGKGILASHSRHAEVKIGCDVF
jgi:hypothetical protein